MEIESLYVYPVKSMRGIALPSATLTPHGFPYDRQFLVVQPTTDKETGAPTYTNITIAPNNEMIRFWQAIDEATGTLTITHKPAGDKGGEERSVDVPLEPETEGLEVIDIMMHKSPTQAYKMEARFNDFLTACFGSPHILAYIGDHRREVRMSSLGHNRSATSTATNGPSTWLTSISTIASQATTLLTGGDPSPSKSEIRFSDVAPYLVVSAKSMDSILSRLPASEQAQYPILKFRPNIVVSGASAVWEEDFWAQLTIASTTQLECEHNCGRCRSINIDYETGEQGTGEAGTMLKKLSKDRRVDAGAKWNPVFGRYAFLRPEFEGSVVRVGDEVVVSRRNEGRTAFDWKGLSTLPGGGKD